MSVSNNGMRYLIVDDMTNMRRTIRNMLRSIGCMNILEAENGEAALNKLSSEKIDFIICDWNMPNMSGIEFLRKIRDDERLKDTPFLMVTAEVEASQIIQAAETDVDGYIIKPFVARTLEEKVNNIYDKRRNPTEVDKLISNATKCCKMGMNDGAISLFEEALKLNPKSARIMHAIGEIYEKMGMEEKALTYYEDAYRINPMYIKVQQSMGDLYIKKGNIDKAMKIIEKIAVISPNSPKRQIQLGKIYLLKGDAEKAEKAFKTAINLEYSNADLHTEIGEIYLNAGHDEMAAKAFKSSLNVTENIYVYNRLGIALRKNGKNLEAVEEYKKALKIAPKDEALHYNLGKALLEAKKHGEAISSFKKALDIDPNFNECKEMLESLKD